MTAMEGDLPKLLERVENATGPNLATEVSLAILLDQTPDGFRFVEETQCWQRYVAVRDDVEIWMPPAYTASLDAALALVEEKLPGWDWSLRHSVSADSVIRYANAVVWVPSDPRDDEAPRYWANHNHSPLLALLAALLRALIAESRVSLAPTDGGDK
jgi:hypothetical protein